MNLSPKDFRVLYKEFIKGQLSTIKDSEDFHEYFFGLDSDERKIIRTNLEKVADIATDNFISDFDPKNSEEERDIQNQILKSIKAAIKEFDKK